MDRQPPARPPSRLSRRHLIAGGAGAVGLTALGPAVASAEGASTAGSGLPLTTLFEPIRLFDSRDPSNFFGGNKLSDGDVVAVIASVPGVDFLEAVFVNVTITQTEGAGFLALRANDESDGVTTPTTSNINWTGPDVTLANLALSRVGAESSIAIFCVGTGAATHVIVDLQGYVAAKVGHHPPKEHDKEHDKEYDKEHDKDPAKEYDKK